MKRKHRLRIVFIAEKDGYTAPNSVPCGMVEECFHFRTSPCDPSIPYDRDRIQPTIRDSRINFEVAMTIVFCEPLAWERCPPVASAIAIKGPLRRKPVVGARKTHRANN